MTTALVVAVAPAAIGLASIACGGDDKAGEDRPGIEVIGGGGSVSISGAVGEEAGSPLFTPSTNQDATLGIGADLADLRTLMAPAGQDRPVDWSAVGSLYQNGKNQKQADGTTRALATIATGPLDAAYPGGVAIYGRPAFIDGMIRDAVAGTGRAAGLPDNARRLIVDRAVQVLMYGEAMRLLGIATTRFEANAGPEAARAIDEAWATLAGPADSTTHRNHGLLATAMSREEDFGLQGKIARPLEASLSAALVAIQQNDREAFARSLANSRAYLNTIFYLSTLRSLRTVAADDRASERTAHIAEGWAYSQALRAQVAGASPGAAQTIESAFSRPGSEELAASIATQAASAMNEPAVLQALAIPKELQVTKVIP